MLTLTLPKDRVAVVLEMKVAELREQTCRLEASVGSLYWRAVVSLSELDHPPYLGERVQVRVLHS